VQVRVRVRVRVGVGVGKYVFQEAKGTNVDRCLIRHHLPCMSPSLQNNMEMSSAHTHATKVQTNLWVGGGHDRGTESISSAVRQHSGGSEGGGSPISGGFGADNGPPSTQKLFQFAPRATKRARRCSSLPQFAHSWLPSRFRWQHSSSNK